MAENSKEWHQVRDLFEDLSAEPQAEQERRLTEIAAIHPELAAEVRRLLGWHQEAGDFLKTAAAPLPELEPEPPPPEIPSYRITGLLGRGGMGSVYGAERADGLYKKPVAVKVLDRSPLHHSLAGRFHTERRILAALDHPHIAKLLDGGTTADARPYFVMELVDGEPIDAWCDRQCLSVEDRLRLFLKVCSAVAYAHQRLVVHRDLKPGNILIGGNGEPKLLDFGIAKLLAPEALDLTCEATELGLAPLTPEFASPEQAAGTAISALSDIYSLGVLLYLLLTGRKPYSLSGLRFDQMVAVIGERQPPRASLVAVGDGGQELAARRQSEPTLLARKLRGDLDTVLAKALAKVPERRYSSVEQFAADLEAFLAGRPVKARPDSLRYRAGKFVGRHRWAVSAAALALATLLALLAGLWRQRLDLLDRQARLIEQKNRAEAVSALLAQVFSSSDPVQSRGREISARELLTNGVGEIDRQLADQPGPRADLLLTMARSFKNLGLYEEAEPLVSRALALSSAGAGADPARQAAALHELAEVASFAGRLAEAERREREALALRESLGGAPDAACVEGYGRLGRILDLAGRSDEAAAVYEEAQALGRTLPPSEALATVLQRFASVERRRDRRQEAEALLREALALQRRLQGEGHPNQTVTANDLGLTLLEMGRSDEAERVLDETAALLRRLYPQGHPQLATTLQNQARLRAEQDLPDEAEALYREALAMLRTVYGGDHPLVATGLASLATLLKRRGRAPEAEALYRDGLDIQRRLLPSPHRDTAATLNDLGLLLLESGRLEEAETPLAAALDETRRALGPGHSQVAVVLGNLGLLAHMRRDLDAARDHYGEALEVMRALSQPKPRDLAMALHNLGTLERDRGDLAAAERRFSEALDKLTASLGDDHLNAAMIRLSLAELRLKAGEPAAAEALASRALERLLRSFPERDAWVIAARKLLAESRRARERAAEAARSPGTAGSGLR